MKTLCSVETSGIGNNPATQYNNSKDQNFLVGSTITMGPRFDSLGGHQKFLAVG